MRKRHLKLVSTVFATILIMGLIVIAAMRNHGYGEAQIQKKEYVLEELQTETFSTTQVPKEEVIQTDTTILFEENSVITSKTQTSKVQGTEELSDFENKEENETTETKEEKTTSEKNISEEDESIISNVTVTASPIVAHTIMPVAATTVAQTSTVTLAQDTTKSTSTTAAITTETTITCTIETAISKLQDCLVIGKRVIPITYGPATQEMVDDSEVVQDTEFWSDEKNIYFFGHNTRSFSCLSHVEIGDIITVINNGNETKYKVFRCENGTLTEDGMNIKSNADGTYLIFKDFGCETIRLITCRSIFCSTANRLVVIGERIE